MKRTPAVETLVAVQWDDACFSLDEADNTDDAHPCTTVGWITRITRASIWIASERLPTGWRGITRIPRAIVKGIHELKGAP